MNLTWLLLVPTALAAASSPTQMSTPASTPAPTPPSSTNASANANWAALGQALQSMRSAEYTMPTPLPTMNLDNISPPPRSLVPQVLSAVPPSILLDLIIPSKRKELASQVQAGSTPAWYRDLPTDVKSYMGVVKSQVQAGALTATPTPTSTGSVASSASATASNGTSSGHRPVPGVVMTVAIAVAVAMVSGMGC